MKINELKAHINILHIAQDLGIQIDPRNKRAHCPFHNDKTPSLQFSEEKQLATCFSSNCTAGSMDVIELVKRKNNWELPETLQYLKQKVGAAANVIPSFIDGTNTKTVQHSNVPKLSEQERILLLTQLFDLFERAFLASKPAKDYAESRNINHKLIQIGYNSGTFHHSVNLPEKNREELINNYEELGLLKKINSGHTVFGKGCLVFPLKNEKNQIVSFYFREIDDSKANKHYYLKQRSGLYPNYPEENTNHIILTECIIDAISLKQSIANNYTILANYGTEGNKEQIEAIQQLNHLEEITLFFDGDAAGQAAAVKHIEQLNQRCPGVKLSTVQTPENEDINSLLLSHQPEIFTHLIQSAAPFFLSEEKENKPNQAKEKASGENDQPQLILTLKGNLLKSEESLKVTIEALNVQTGKKLRDKVELYEYKQVDRFIKTIAEKLYLPEHVADDSIHAFIEELEEKRYRMKVQSPNKNQEQALNPQEMEECINFGKQPNLIEELNNLIGKSGIVGEEKNRLFLFGIASSHKMKKTLHVVVQGSSGSGKTHLIKKVADLMPQENVKRFTRISEKSFYNYGEHDLVNHLIVLEDYDGMKEEAEFALRELQSNEILISSTSKKDETTGEIKSGENKVRGPIASMVATTHGEMYHDNETRVFFISIDETEEQTHKIINYKNQLSAGEINQREQEEATLFIQRFIRSLQPKEVKNTWIKHIDLPVHPDQKRRLHSLFQAFCEQVTLLHQHQRQQDDHGRLITQKQDIELAIDLMFESIILKVDELNGRLRDFYEKVKNYVHEKGKDYEFEQREIRHALTMSKTHVFRNLTELIELEYIQKTTTGNRNTFGYKITYWDNLEALRTKIKQHIEAQLKNIN